MAKLNHCHLMLYLGPSINELVVYGNTKICCRGFVLVGFQSRPVKLMLNIPKIIKIYPRYAKLKYDKLQ